MINIIKRASIPEINSIFIAGKEHKIGAVQPLAHSAIFRHFRKDNEPLSISFTRLEKGETHQVHQHSVDSMVIVMAGKATLLGDATDKIETGDVVCIPAGCWHGFCCDLGEPLDALSVQYEPLALFEKEADIVFTPQLTPYQALLNFNEQWCAKVEKTLFFSLFREGQIQTEHHMTLFKTRLRQWSEIFQYIMYARQSTVVDPTFRSLFLEHFQEELGHDELLPKSQEWDAKIDSYGNWFVLKMFQLDNVEKLAVVHLVLEKCADAFHWLAKNTSEQPGEYIEAHATLDHGHALLGSELYQDITHQRSIELQAICEQAWQVMQLLLDRIATLTLEAIEQDEAVSA
ncbi:cupin domain-containing protein [Xenorhabdus sp. SGI246]|uniref:cupin domain-containing protein n=1 Tax=Xenorhabdus sp. SGI246 TaxID=3158263 RepID=UPI00349FA006